MTTREKAFVLNGFRTYLNALTAGQAAVHELTDQMLLTAAIAGGLTVDDLNTAREEAQELLDSMAIAVLRVEQ